MVSIIIRPVAAFYQSVATSAGHRPRPGGPRCKDGIVARPVMGGTCHAVPPWPSYSLILLLVLVTMDTSVQALTCYSCGPHSDQVSMGVLNIRVP